MVVNRQVQPQAFVREGFRGPDLEILGTGSWTLGGRGFRASQEWVEERRSGISAGPGTEGAGTRVCGHVIKEE